MRKSIALVALLCACAPEAPAPAAVDAPIPVDAAPFIARAAAHADMEMQALVRSQLTVVDGCVRLGSVVGNPGYLVVWPRETTIHASTGAVRIAFPGNGSVFSIGDTVEMNGGEASALDPSAFLEPPPAACAGPYWIAGSHLAKTAT